ncbi:hypothetical protein HK405_004812, partial [Cladochytrium tenue]
MDVDDNTAAAVASSLRMSSSTPTTGKDPRQGYQPLTVDQPASFPGAGEDSAYDSRLDWLHCNL